MTGEQHHAADASGRRGAAGFGDAFDREPRLLRAARRLFERGGVGQRTVDQIEIGKFARQPLRIREPGVAILRRHIGHRNRALGQRCNAIACDVIGGHHRLPAADQHAQADVVALRAFRFLDGAVAHLDRLRHRAHRHRIGRIGAGGARGLQQTFRKRGQG